MAVVSVKELHQYRRSSIDESGNPTHTRAFLVITDDKADGTAVALTAKVMSGETVAAAVPAYRSPHPKSDGTRALSISAEPHNDSDLHFRVTVEYAIPDFGEVPDDPLKMPAEITYGATESTEPYLYDRSPEPEDWAPSTDGTWRGRPVVNSAGDRFDEFRERESSEEMITVVTNEATYSSRAMRAYRQTVNAEDITIDGETYPAGTLKLSPITAQRIWHEPTAKFYYRVIKVVKSREEGWNDYVLDLGTAELDYKTADPPPRHEKCNRMPILDASGQRVEKPWPLNGKGKKKPNPTDVPATLEFRPYAWKSWAALKWS